MPRKYLLLLAAAMLCAAAAAGWARTTRHVPVLERLERARPERTFAPRLSIDTEYRPCKTLGAHPDSTVPRERCGTDAEPGVDPHSFALAGESSAPDSLQASALAAVIWWDETDQSMHEAVRRLKKAIRLSREPVPLLVDLSATYLVRGERTQSPRDLLEGMNAAYEALSHEPGNSAALFNAALALQALGVDEQAALAWNAFLAADSASPWAHEARVRMRALITRAPSNRGPRPGATAAEVDSFAARYPQEARLLGWGRVLGGWAQAVENDDSGSAALYLELAERLGAALERRDASLADAVRAIRTAASDPSATAALARGHRRYAAADSLSTAGEHREAAAIAARVARAGVGSPTLAQSAELIRTAALVLRNEYDSTKAALETLLPRIDTMRHPALAARVQWQTGTSLMRASRTEEIQDHYRRAAAIYERLGETEHTATMWSLEAEAAHLRGDTAWAYSSMHRGMRALREYRGSVRLQNNLMVLADWATMDGLPWAAPLIQEEQLSVATRTGRPGIAFEALLARAYVRVFTGDVPGARRDVDSAAPLLSKIRDKDVQRWAQAELGMSRVMVQREKAGPALLAALDSSVAFFAAEKHVQWLSRALLQRVEARLAAGDLAGAAADLERFTDEVRTHSGAETNAALRTAMVEQARARFDQLVMLHLQAADTVEALRALERGRVSRGPAPAAARAAARAGERAKAPPGEVAVEYALIGDTLLAWTVRADSVHLHRAVVSRGEFLRVADQVNAVLEGGRPELAEAGLRRLYEWLIRPVRHRLGGTGTTLVILADGEVAGVPFPALRDSARGAYLVQDHAVRYAATLADAALARPPRSAAPPRALLVADPAFDRRAHPTLDPLPVARTEARGLRELYPDHELLDSTRATRAALIAGTRSAGVIHYAGHALFDDARPERSFLVLADSGEAGHLTADSVSAMRLPGVRLVVLSACRTLRSREGRSGGFAGFSGALLAAGAGGVMGSLWEVDDRHTRPLMEAFHREYLDSGNPAAALRQAQLQMLASGDPDLGSPSTWAGFRYAGR
jgi:CHAT domain-containing protein